MLQNALMQLSTTTARLIYKDKIFTTPHLVNHSLKICNYIDKMQAKQKGPIAFCLPNSPELLCWYLACFYKGVPVVPILYDSSKEQIHQIMEQVHPAHLMITSSVRKRLNEHDLYGGALIHINDDTGEGMLKDTNPALISLRPAEVDEKSLAIIIFNFDKNKNLKGIKHSYASAFGFLQTMLEAFNIEQGLTYLIAQPMGHMNSVIIIILTLLNQGSAVLMPEFDANHFMTLMASYRPTHLSLHPPLFKEILNYPYINKKSFANVVTCYAGMESITRDLPAKFTEATGAPMQTGFGEAEIGLVFVNPKPYQNYAKSFGKKINSAKIEIRDNQQNPVPVNAPGEVWVKTPGCCLGYWLSPEQHKKLMVDGWFRTDAKARLDEDGFYWGEN